MKTIIHIIIKELLQFKRDTKMRGISFVAPVLQLILLGYAANLDVKNISMLVCDMDKTQYSRQFIDNYTNSGYFSANYYVDKINDIDYYIDSGKAAIGIVIPMGFTNKLISGKQAQLQVIVDGTDTNSATIGLGYATIITSQYSQKILVEQVKRIQSREIKLVRINPEMRVWYNPELKSRNFMIPGILALILMVMTIVLTSLAIVKEKEYGTLEQIIVTPIKPYQLIIGKLVPFAMIGLIDVILVICVARFWFNVPLNGSVILLFVLCNIFLLSTLGLGLLVSTVSKNQQQAMMTAMFYIMLPMFFLSGFVFPIENMPKFIQPVTYLLPLRYFFVIVRGLFLKGVGMAELWDETLILILFGIGILAVSAIRFHKKLD